MMVDSNDQEHKPLSRAEVTRRMRARQREAGKVHVSFAMASELVAEVDRLKSQLGVPARAEVFEAAIRQLVQTELQDVR